jgi:hypothetical protein
VETLVPGTEIDADGLQLPGAPPTSRLRIEQRIGDAPHGDNYRGTVGGLPVLVTYLDPALAAQADVRAWLLRNVARAAAVEHRSLLAQHGALSFEHRCLLVQGNPGGQSARQLLIDRSAKGRSVDVETAQTIIGHVCNALDALHTVMVHGYVNADAVWISTSGRVSLGDPGVGALLSRTRRFDRLRAAGRLGNVAPEQMLSPPQLASGTDVFGVASLLVELLTGRALREAGAPLEENGIFGPPDLLLCLERATAPDVGARPPDVLTFKAELAEALGAGARVDIGPPRPTEAPLPAGMVMPNLQGGRAPPPPPPARAGAMPPRGTMPPPPPGTMPAHGMMPPPPPGMTPAHGMMPPPPPGMTPTHGIMQPPPGMAMMMPPGYSQVGMVVAGPDGVPTVVPMMVGMPVGGAMPVAADPRQRARSSAAVDPETLRELERATRRIAEASSKEAVLDLTEDVAESSTRLAADPDDAAASASLRLELSSFDDAAGRLETVDGEIPPEAAIHKPSGSGSGSYFGSFGDSTVDTAIANSDRERIRGGRRGTVAIDEDDLEEAPRTYRLIRDGQDSGEHSLAELRQLVIAGRLGAADTLVHPLTKRRLRVLDVAELRQELSAAGRANVGPLPGAMSSVAQRPMMLQPARGGAGGTLLWIVLALVTFGGVGVWLWLRGQG